MEENNITSLLDSTTNFLTAVLVLAIILIVGFVVLYRYFKKRF